MNGKPKEERQALSAEWPAWIDPDLTPADVCELEKWLRDHPDAAQDSEGVKQLVRLYRDHPAPEPSEPRWQLTLSSIHAALPMLPVASSMPGRPWRWGLLAGMVAATLGGVLLARAFWPGRATVADPVARSTAMPSNEEEAFAVAELSEVHIIRIDPRDADRVVMGVPLMGAFELVGTEEIDIEEVESDLEGGNIPHVQARAGGPILIVARSGEDE